MRNLTLIILFISSANLFAQTDFTADTVCYGNYTTFTGSSSLADTAIASWNWDLDNDSLYDDAFGKVITYTFPQADTFSVGLKIIPNFQPVDSVTKLVYVNPVPDVNFHVDNACALQEAIYIDQTTITSGTVTQWMWDFDNNDTIDYNLNDTAYYTVGPASTYVSKLTCISDRGCSAFATKTTEIFPMPVPDFTVWDLCAGDSTVFYNTTTINDSIAYYLWDFGDGEMGTTLENPKHMYNTAGTYTVTLIAMSANDCSDTLYMSVDINPVPLDSLQIDVNATAYIGDSVVFFEGENALINVVGDVVDFEWSTGEQVREIMVTTTGTYTVTATDINGCQDVLSVEVIVKPIKNPVSVANSIITPNGDGFNDFLEIEDFAGYDNCTIVIFNRWNNLVFDGNDFYDNQWSGTSNTGKEKEVDPGTYFYIIKCDDYEEIKGSINILR